MLISSIVTLLAAYIGFRASGLNNKHKTYIKMMECNYFPIFQVLEKSFFREITLSEAIDLGNKIVSIIDKNPMYIDPSLRIYANRLVNSNQSDFQNNFMTFCSTFDENYDKTSRLVGIPLRSYAYRIDMGQYENKFKLYLYCIVLTLPEFLFLLILVILSFSSLQN